jgi:hypothetical protein
MNANVNPTPGPNEGRPAPLTTADLARDPRGLPPEPDTPRRPDGGTLDRRMEAPAASAAAAARARGTPVGAPEGERPVALFPPDVCQHFRAHWDEVQIGFVDDPQQAVKRADELVAQVMNSLAASFARERSQLEAFMAGQGDGGPNTENLRVALQRYRSFFQRLLTL